MRGGRKWDLNDGLEIPDRLVTSDNPNLPQGVAYGFLVYSMYTCVCVLLAVTVLSINNRPSSHIVICGSSTYVLCSHDFMANYHISGRKVHTIHTVCHPRYKVSEPLYLVFGVRSREHKSLVSVCTSASLILVSSSYPFGSLFSLLIY